MSEGAQELAQLIVDGAKVGWHKERVEAWHRGERVAPITMDIAWTRRCNAACLSPDARVEMADGSFKRMADIKAGDWLASSDDGVIRKSMVMWAGETSKRKRLLALRVGKDILRCTSDHLILTPAGYVEAGGIMEGDYVATSYRKGDDRQRESALTDAREQSHEATGRSAAHGRNEESTAQLAPIFDDKRAPREWHVSAGAYERRATPKNLGADVSKQPYEDCVRGGASDRYQQGERQLRSSFGSNEADMGGGEDYIRPPEDGRWPQDDKSERSQAASYSRPIGTEVHGRLLVLAGGQPCDGRAPRRGPGPVRETAVAHE
jgi:hypothetical protein